MKYLDFYLEVGEALGKQFADGFLEFRRRFDADHAHDGHAGPNFAAEQDIAGQVGNFSEEIVQRKVSRDRRAAVNFRRL